MVCIGAVARIVRCIRLLGRQITLEQNRGGNSVHCAFALLPADIGGDQKIFRGLRGQPFVPEDERHRQPRFQFRSKPAHRLNSRPLAAVQLKRQSQNHSRNLMRPDQRRDVGDIPIDGPPLEGFEWLRRPA